MPTSLNAEAHCGWRRNQRNLTAEDAKSAEAESILLAPYLGRFDFIGAERPLPKGIGEVCFEA